MAALSFGYGAHHAPAANDQPVNIYLFWTKGCPHCALEKQYLAKLAEQDKAIKIITLELTESGDNLELFKKVGQALQADVSGVFFTVVGRHDPLLSAALQAF